MIFDKLKNINNAVVKQCYSESINIPIEAKVLKLTEEAGEVASTLLAAKNYANKSKSSVKDIEDLGEAEALIEETIDVLIVADDLLEKIKQEYSISDSEMLAMVVKIFDKKYKKWQSKINSDNSMTLNIGI